MEAWYLTEEGAKQYCRSPRLSNEYIAWPAIKELCGNINGKLVLDLGTAAGETARKLALLGAFCTGVDISPSMLDFARSIKEPKVEYLLRDCANLEGIHDNQFDVTTMNFLLCDIDSRDKIGSILEEAYRVTKPSGKAIFTFPHPLQLMLQNEEMNPYSPVSSTGPTSYFESGAEIKRVIRTADNGFARVKNYHWTIEDYIAQFVRAGFLVDAVREPKPIDVPPEFQEVFKMAYTLPLYVVVRGIKMYES